MAAPVRIGVIGCGAIAQVHHLPNLSLLREEFEIAAVCDISESLVKQIATEYNVPHHFTDYRDLLACDVDATLLCASDPKTEFGVDSFDAGKHTFIEKPLCFTLEDADRLIDANGASGCVGQVGYMKVHDPAFELVEREVRAMEGRIRYIQANHLHTNNNHHLRHFRIVRRHSPPPGAAAPAVPAKRSAAATVLGDIPPEVERVFGILRAASSTIFTDCGICSVTP